MIANLNNSFVSPEDYLLGEVARPMKHEYRDGDIYAHAYDYPDVRVIDSPRDRTSSSGRLLSPPCRRVLGVTSALDLRYRSSAQRGCSNFKCGSP